MHTNRSQDSLVEIILDFPFGSAGIDSSEHGPMWRAARSAVIHGKPRRRFTSDDVAAGLR